MRSVIVGAGAIGAFVGASMARAGQDVTLVARGAHLRAMQEDGVHVRTPEGDWHFRPKVTGDLEEVGPVDTVFLAMKAHSLPEIAPQLPVLFGPNTTVVSMQNGIPWWFFDVPGLPYSGLQLSKVDPDGGIAGAIETRRVLGSIVYVAAEITAPGHVRHIENKRISLGEPDGSKSERLRLIADAFLQAGLKAPVTTHIRTEVWLKLLGNMGLNPISALTGGTLVRLIRNPDTREVVRSIMQEGLAVGEKIGIEVPISIEQRLEGAASIGEHKTSMLQDWEAGRPLELDAITGAPLEVGETVGVPMPCTRTVYACTKFLEQARRRG